MSSFLTSPISPLDSVAHIIQLALTPIFLLSGIGALLNVFATRLARVADRVDQITKEMEAAEPERIAVLAVQMARLRRRSVALDAAVVLAAFGAAATCASVLTLFVGAIGDKAIASALFVTFALAVICTIGAIIAYTAEMLMTGVGVRAEVAAQRQSPGAAERPPREDTASQPAPANSGLRIGRPNDRIRAPSSRDGSASIRQGKRMLFRKAPARRGRVACGPIAAIVAVIVMLVLSATAPAAEPTGKPIVIGFSMALTGGLAVNGTSALLAMQIWADDTNKKGGLLGRPVKLDFYDDQSNPSLVPGIYTKLLDVDKVDLVVSGYATNIAAPAMPVVIAHNMNFIGLFALDINEEFQYPKYFSMLPVGPDPRPAISEGFFNIVKAQQDKLGLKTIALAVDDGEATRNAADGARINLKKAGLKIVYDRNYPPNTADFTPIIRAIQATHPDIVYISSYPPDSVGIIRSVHELGLDTKIFGGNLTGPQSTSIKTSLGPMLNGIITFDWWLPALALRFPGVMEFLQEYQARAKGKGVDPLGYYLAPWAYADLQVLGEAVQGSGGLDQDKIADYIRSHTFKTVVGDVQFGKKGEWAKSRIMTIQFQNITSTSVNDFRDGKGETVLWPDQFKAGDPILPYSQIKH